MAGKPITENTLFYGDNLDFLRKEILSESIDLVYLDPPFNSNRNYNVLFKDEHGAESESQITAFEDSWHWNQQAEDTYLHLVTISSEKVSNMISSLRSLIGENQMMAYLVMMTVRLVELHRVLKPTGSLYLHCDPTASHYLKIILDVIFGNNRFLNEVIWYYGPKATQNETHFQRKHDVIFIYTKTSKYTFNTLFQEYSDASLLERETRYNHEDESGQYRETTRRDKDGKKYRAKVYLKTGVAMTDVWDIGVINATSKERLGYEGV